jgi:precorrin-2/cobalt-factor-2 C20-methyltransferase
MASGKVFLVGVGPGDPELVTRKAARVLREADIVYHPGPSTGQGFAVRIVQDLLAPGCVVRAAAVEMSAAGNRYEMLAAELAREAEAGHRVAFITEGDPLFYSTAGRVLEQLRQGYPALPLEIIPGVTSLTAAAAAASTGLVQGAETLLVVPACHHPDRLESMMEAHDRVALLKLQGVFSDLVAILRRRGWLDRAVYVERVGTPEQRIRRDLTAIDPSSVSYFSLLLLGPPPLD